MKRFSPREFALLCAPVLAVAVAGILLSRRKAPRVLNAGPLRLKFRVEKPTELEAFQGANAALDVSLVGEGADKMSVANPSVRLELETTKGIEASNPFNSSREKWGSVWKTIYGWRFLINSQTIPQGKLRFNMNAEIIDNSTGTLLFSRSGDWPINRTQLQPFPFNKMDQVPPIILQSARITKVEKDYGPSGIYGECVFRSITPKSFAQMPLDFSLFRAGTPPLPVQSSVGVGNGWNTLTPDAPRRCVIGWFVLSSPHHIEKVSGRVSADNHWPLAFQTEPFDTAKVKVGQKLQFKSWPAPVPKP